MERENYYLLLGLSVDPEEKDPQIIEEAIKRKQSQWSRDRNHPTKAIQSKQYIGLIPEIRRVMTDNELREAEARNAKKALLKSEEAKFLKIDRHIEILMSKGSVTKKEVAELAKIHAVEEDKIRERIKKREKFFKIDRDIRLLMQKGGITGKKTVALAKRYAIGEEKVREWIEKKREETFSEIGKYLELRESVGYITEEAITQMARIYGFAEGDILMRAKCPVRKKGSPEAEGPKPLEKSVEKLINDNLKIVDKSTLYDFLGLPPESALPVLQEKAKEKETEIRKIGQKDAITTASGALVGHCIVIFKSKESRTAYDLTRSRIHLSEFNSDINVAGTDGKIRIEYFDILIKRAMKIGMDVEEAVEYIREYCRNNQWIIKEKKKLLILDKKKVTFLEKWTVELNPRKKSFWILCGSVLSAILVIVGAIVISGRVIQANRIKNAYQTALTSLESQQSLGKKEKVLQDFINRYGETEYAATFKMKIRDIRKHKEKQDFEAVIRDAEKLNADKKFEASEAVYEQYLKQYPKGTYTGEIKKKISVLPGLIDDRDYGALRAADQGNYAEKIKGYNEYFSKHPEGRHIEDVKKLVANMIGEYHRTFKKNVALCEKQREWEACIRVCDDFIEKFGGTEQASEAAGLKVKYHKRIGYKTDLAGMKGKAAQAGIDYLGAKEIYSEYLVANPEAPSYVKDIISKEIADLERKHQTYIREEKEWEELLAYSNDLMNTLGDRVEKLERYIRQNPSGRYSEEADVILEQLKHKKQREDKHLEATRGQREWREIVAYSKNLRISLTKRIGKLEAYIRQNSSGSHIRDATSILNRLKREKSVEDERIRADRARKERMGKELKRMRSLVRKTSGRFVANGNGTITDKKTGLMWTALDSSTDLGRCVDHQTAVEYVKRLKTGRYDNWRIPDANELVGIYKTRPFFPSGSAKWYWTSDIIWHGWNKKAHVVTSERETAWNKDQADLLKCGSVRAVRR